MKKLILLSVVVASIAASCSCHRLKQAGKDTVNSAGQVVGAGASEFVSGVVDGVDKTFQSTLLVSDSLKAKGLGTGKFAIDHNRDSADRITIYCIFAKEFNHDLTVKVYDQKGTEYGRSSVKVTAKANDAHYIDFIFDKRTVIESKSKFTLD